MLLVYFFPQWKAKDKVRNADYYKALEKFLVEHHF